MQVEFTDAFSCYYKGEKLVFSKGDTTTGWPAKRALAGGVAVPTRKIPEVIADVNESESDAS